MLEVQTSLNLHTPFFVAKVLLKTRFCFPRSLVICKPNFKSSTSLCPFHFGASLSKSLTGLFAFGHEVSIDQKINIKIISIPVSIKFLTFIVLINIKFVTQYSQDQQAPEIVTTKAVLIQFQFLHFPIPKFHNS